MAKGVEPILAATTGAVAWSVYDAGTIDDKFDATRIQLFFATQPTSAGLVTVSIDSAEGTAFDGILRSMNPVGKSTLSLEDINGIDPASKLLVSYANPDGVEITGEATIQRFRFKR